MRVTFLATILILTVFTTHAYELSDGEPWLAGEATFHTTPLSTTGSGLTSNLLRDAFIDSMNEWTNNSNFNYLATTGSADPCSSPNSSSNPSANNNGFKFDDHACLDSQGNEIQFGSATVAVAITWQQIINDEPAQIIQSGVVFNSAKDWIITGVTTGSGADFRRIAVHELGHSLGLGHTSVTPAIMLPVASSIEVPQLDDLQGVEQLYGVFDSDGDGVGNSVDNCPDDANTDQADFNNDDEGDACDNSDNDSLFDDVDNCPLTTNQDQADFNNDNEGDVCDDTDNDGVFDDTDNCRLTSNLDQNDINNDNEGDACDNSDNDSLLDDVDNCPFDENEQQENLDQDEYGDACDNDADGDGVLFGIGDSDDMNPLVCSDTDGDGASCDDCSSGMFDPNNDGPDADNDGLCNDFETDDDNDGVDDDFPDNCPNIPNPLQEDRNNNGVGDACEDDELCLPIKADNNNTFVICI